MSTTIDRGPGAADTSPHPDDLSTRDHSDHDGGAVGATAPLQRGAVLGRYIIVGAIGAGGMGTVYAAYDAELDRRLAIKVLNVGADSPSRSNRHQRLIREARALAKLSHPNVIPIYDVGNIGETEIFLAMELVTGGTLDGWVRGPERSWREIVAVYCAAGRGLSAAHAAGLVHRDFKPANVLVGGDRRPRVTDFGLVRTYASGRQSVSLNEDGDDGAVHLAMEDSEVARTLPRDRGGERTTDSPGVLAATVQIGRAAERVRARGAAGAAQRRPGSGPLAPSRNPLNESLTAHGAIMGTPRFMAPEQHLGLVADAVSDQFSFCVALYRALYGQSPFPGDTLDSLRAAVLGGELCVPEGQGRTAGGAADDALEPVPDPVFAILRRGLSTEPGDRYPSMDELLDALRTQLEAAAGAGRAPSRWSALAGVGLLAAAAAVLAYAVSAGDDRDTVCQGAPELARAVWNPDRAARISAAFATAGLSYAADSARAVQSGMDRHVDAWVAMHTEACRATRIHGSQSEALLDRRMNCLDEELQQVDQLAAVLAEATADTVEHAVEAVAGIGTLDRCADVEALLARVAPPDDAETRQQVAAIDRELARIRALRAAYRDEQALAAMTATLAAARATEYPPVLARTLLLAGQLHLDSDDKAASDAALSEAAAQAMLARDDDTLAEVLVERLSWVREKAAYDESKRWVALARAAVARQGDQGHRQLDLHVEVGRLHQGQGQLDEAAETLGQALTLSTKIHGDEHLTTARVLRMLGSVELERGSYERFEDYNARALAIQTALLGEDHPALGGTFQNLGSAAYRQAEYDKALDYYRRALAIREASVGEMHSRTADSVVAIGIALNRLGRLDESLAAYQRALAITEHVHGPEHPETAHALTSMGGVYNTSGDHQTAYELNRRALAIHRKTLPPGHHQIALVLGNLGIELKNLGRYDESVRHYQEALAIFEEALGAEHINLAVVRINLGETLHRQGKLRDALASYRRGRDIWTAALGEDHVGLIHALNGMAEVYLDLGQPEQSIPLVERGISLQPPDNPDLIMAEARFTLARALVAARARDTAAAERARILAEKARDSFAALGRDGDRDRAAAWLARLK